MTEAQCVQERPLTEMETRRLDLLEGIIHQNFMAFVAVGKALQEIRDNRLYRTEDGRTWEGYCRELWDMSHQRADQLISAKNVVEGLTTIVVKEDGTVDQELLPANEAQARELTRLQPDEQRQVWQQLLTMKEVATAKGEPLKLTAKAISRAISDYKGEQFEKTMHRTRNTLRTNREQFSSDAFTATWEQFLLQVEQERSKGWRDTSRKTVFELLAALTESVGEAGKKALTTASIEYQASDREKLKAAGLTLYRLRCDLRGGIETEPETYLIEQWDHGDAWLLYDEYPAQEAAEAAFAELMREPTNIQA